MTAPVPKRRRIWLRALLAAFLLLVVYFGWFGYMFMTAEARVRVLCERIRPGTSLAELQRLAHAEGMWPAPSKWDGETYFVEQKTLGRFGCKLLMEGGVVKSAVYMFHD